MFGVTLLWRSNSVLATIGNVCRCVCGNIKHLAIYLPPDECRLCVSDLCRDSYPDSCYNATAIATTCLNRHSRRPKYIFFGVLSAIAILFIIGILDDPWLMKKLQVSSYLNEHKNDIDEMTVVEREDFNWADGPPSTNIIHRANDTGNQMKSSAIEMSPVKPTKDYVMQWFMQD